MNPHVRCGCTRNSGWGREVCEIKDDVIDEPKGTLPRLRNVVTDRLLTQRRAVIPPHPTPSPPSPRARRPTGALKVVFEWVCLGCVCLYV